MGIKLDLRHAPRTVVGCEAGCAVPTTDENHVQYLSMATERHLTRTQKRLIDELDKITSAAGLDYWNILDRDPRYDPHRTVVLQAIMREIVRGEVVSQYTLIDEHLGSRICHYLFDNSRFDRLWRTKKFERFNYFVLEKMSMLEKLAFVKDVYILPKAIAADIEAINAIRNALAHAFFPENLRVYRTKRGAGSRTVTGPRYKGVDIFTFDGVDRFLDDSHRVVHFLIMNISRKRGKRITAAATS